MPSRKDKGKPRFGMDHLESSRREQVLTRLRRGTLDPEIARQALGGKPIEEWDLDELARGRPRASDGSFKGPAPTWVTAELKEEAYNRFKEYVKGELAGGSLRALSRIKDLIDDAESDRVRLDASKFVLEHLIGRPTQEVKGDISLNLQQILAGVLVNPNGAEAIDVEAEYEELEDDLEDLED